MVVVAALALLLTTSRLAGPAAASGPAIPMRSEEGRRLQATSLQEVANSAGATLEAVHAHRLEDGTHVHVRHTVDPPAAEPSAPRFDLKNRRDLVRLLLHMNIVAYAKKERTALYSEEVMRPIVEDHDSLYGPEVKTYADEAQKEIEHMNKWINAFNGTYKADTGGTGIDASEPNTTGVHALEFTIPGLGKVLAFRGSASTGDFENIQLWFADWLATNAAAKMKHAWTTVARLPWSREMDQSSNRLTGFVSRHVLHAGAKASVNKFKEKMKELAERTKGLVDQNKAAETGYWEFTKLIAKSVRDKLKPGEELYLTGHSQGGTRAALVSMFYEKMYKEVRQTVTFAAAGGQCFSRKFSFTGVSLAGDVELDKTHGQITDYVHPLDIPGTFDYVFGTRCIYGMTGIKRSNAKKYCEKVFGRDGAYLAIAGAVGHSRIDADFARCRYFTHTTLAIDRALMDDIFLKEDGTTDGGCEAVPPIPDGDKRCKSSARIDTCTKQLSCPSCQVSSSALGFNCRWCESSMKCVSRADVCFKCEAYTPRDECPAPWLGSASHDSALQIEGSVSGPVGGLPSLSDGPRTYWRRWRHRTKHISSEGLS